MRYPLSIPAKKQFDFLQRLSTWERQYRARQLVLQTSVLLLEKFHGHDHNRAFEDVGEELSKCVKAILERDRHAGAEWTGETEITTATGRRSINEWESESPCTSRYSSSLVDKQLSNLRSASILYIVDDTIGEFN